MTMYSCIYTGHVRHRRFSPVVNQFLYRLYLMYLDLAELPLLFQGRRLWSGDGVAAAYFRRRDHLGDPRAAIDRAVRDLVHDRLGSRPAGPIRLLTHLRYFGFCFNPVSFYYCFDPNGGRVETIVAEVHNTPWNEEHCYVFGESMNRHETPGWKRYCFDKAFHVSPFMEMEIRYDWRFREPSDTLSVHIINNMPRGGRRFDATLRLRRVPISGRSLTKVLLAYPLMTLKVTAMIYFQALRLLAKGAPVHVHPAKRTPRPLR